MIAVSLLSSYDYCPRKLFLEHVLKLAVVPREAVVKGSVRHAVHERASKAEAELVKSIKNEINHVELIEKYKKLHSDVLKDTIVRNKSKLAEVKVSLTELFKEAWPRVLQESQQKALNLHEFMKKNKVFGEELWKMLSPKIESEYYVESEDLMLKGVIDQLEVYDNKLVKEVVPYELKTGSAPKTGVWPGHKLQAGAYIMLLEKNRFFVREAFVKYLDINEARHVMMNPFLEKHVLQTRDSIIELFQGKDLPLICDNKKKCSSCSLKEQCWNEKFIKEKMVFLS
ncbi:Dna2/Cas4 domain-containing protein [Candidatus Woesearchaeota archaeon]|nr:Dna2/Cas4 domain-containing protein [Candidatus Woesearchaeota archaeon]